MNIFYPCEIKNSAYELTGEYFIKKGIKGIIFDIDNTLVPYSVKDCPEETEMFFKSLEESGLFVSFVSNNNGERVKRFIGGKHFFVEKAGKPSKKGAVAVMEHFGVKANEIAVVGDQIFTDIWFANNSGAFSVLVPPINPKCEPWYFVFKRAGEKIILHFYNKAKR